MLTKLGTFSILGFHVFNATRFVCFLFGFLVPEFMSATRVCCMTRIISAGILERHYVIAT